ncbi:hypothetical protein HELRODRAFT_159213 [Helobdella robusta]|uniref:Uncharacterized protein n=1 Tax=Helobdella robusta TaxID=6412 RepID=T1ENR2_HELRO|nr:hypothetical protein HELRODRAFT_159213 [Helobdella robusta]ESO12639.1 hypothetical protein HELRODRAFT_159213 [Helobdella robusta]
MIIIVDEDDDDDDNFLTPSSTPQEELPASADLSGIGHKRRNSADNFNTDDFADFENSAQTNTNNLITESLIREKIYEKYTVSFSNLKVLIGHADDNWKSAYGSITSLWHVVNKFDVVLLFERRLIRTCTNEWPNVIISASIPSIEIHVNEFKLSALKTCMQNLMNDLNRALARKQQPSTGQQAAPPQSSFVFQRSRNSSRTRHISGSKSFYGDEPDVECKLLFVDFIIYSLSLDVHWRGHSIGQLRVDQVGATAHMTHRRSLVSFSVNSLIIVDAMQTWGPDYDLLVASHNFSNLLSCRDGEEATDLNSNKKTNYNVNAFFYNSPNKFAGYSYLNSAIKAIPNQSTFPNSSVPSFTGSSEFSESLIQLTIDIKKNIKCEELKEGDEGKHDGSESSPVDNNDDDGGDGADDVNIDFNFSSMDVIANQRTIAEMISFFKVVIESSDLPSTSVSPLSPSTIMENSLVTPSQDRRLLDDLATSALSQHEVKGDEEDHKKNFNNPNNFSIPANSSSIPTNNSSAPANNSSAPANNSSAPANNSSTPANNSSTPTNNFSTPPNNSSTPTNNRKMKVRSRFGQLNMMLVSFEGEKAKKVALITLNDALIYLNIG